MARTVTQADIERELRALDTTIGAANPFNQGVGDCFDRTGVLDQSARRLKPRAGTGPKLAQDATVARLVGDIASREAAMAHGESKSAPRKRPVPGQPKGGIKQIRGPHTKDHVGQLHAFKYDSSVAFTSSNAATFRFDDAMKEELATRDPRWCMKKDEFRDYTEALAKYKHLSGDKY